MNKSFLHTFSPMKSICRVRDLINIKWMCKFWLGRNDSVEIWINLKLNGEWK